MVPNRIGWAACPITCLKYSTIFLFHSVYVSIKLKINFHYLTGPVCPSFAVPSQYSLFKFFSFLFCTVPYGFKILFRILICLWHVITALRNPVLTASSQTCNIVCHFQFFVIKSREFWIMPHFDPHTRRSTYQHN